MKALLFILIVALIYYFGFSTKEPEVEQKLPKPKSGLAPLPNAEKPKKQWSSDNVLQGYTDAKQKAKDMEQEVLKAAQRQKKAIDG